MTSLPERARRLFRRVAGPRPPRPARPARSQTPRSSEPLHGYAARLPEPRAWAVVLAAPGVASAVLQRWVDLLDPAVTRIVPAGGAHTGAQLRETLIALGPVDVIVDLSGDVFKVRFDRWRRVFFHLRRGGLYVFALDDSEPDFDAAAQRWAAGPRAGEQAAELASAVGATVASPRLLLIEKRMTHRLKLRDHEVDEVLSRREPDLEVTELTRLPAGVLTSPARVHHHANGLEVSWPDAELPYPTMHLRRYRGEIAFHGATLMHTGHTILPDSFRWHASAYLSNPNAINATADFARVPPRTLPDRSLTGSYYQLDPQYGGFGHVMTEVVGRLWGWDQAKEADPDLKALFWVAHIRSYRDTPKYRVLRGYGIDDADIVAVDRPVWTRSMTSGTVMWHNAEPYYVHPALVEVWRRLGRGLIAPATPTYDKIFVGRTAKYSRRTCHNAPEVEAVFAEFGFTCVYPELLDLSEQAAVFSQARVIAGFAGSGLFNMMFAERLEVTIVLGHDAYFHRNEHLFSALLGGDVHYFWSRADRPPEGQEDAVLSEWSFDFEGLGAELRELLAAL